ncbi:MAG: type II secretion system F family protein [Gammaproteobacteria bacterium]|nr:type II secretion system F family protein [Gammaproteobacteria bacterium]
MSRHKKTKLQCYVWNGCNAAGEKLRGEINAASLILAKAQIRHQGILLQSMQKKPTPLWTFARTKKLRPSDIAIILRQLATLINASIPIVQSVALVAEAQTHPQSKPMLFAIKAEIASGTPFSKALAQYPQYFSALTCNLLDAGEQSGTLDAMLERVAHYAQKTENLKKKLKKALMYPITVVLIAFLITLGLLVFIVPTFKQVFDSFNAPLPLATRFVINLSDHLKYTAWVIIGIAILGFYGLKHVYQSHRFLAEKIDSLLLKIPLIGTILSKASIARFAHTLATTVAAGLPLVKALQTVAEATGNSVFRKATLKIRDEVAGGQKIQVVMRYTEVFPPLVVQMVGVGENAGSLELMLAKVADFYETDVNHAVDNLSTLLEPILMVILGIVVGGLVVALYLPVFKLGAVIH